MDKFKENSKYKTIGEVAKILRLYNKKMDLYQRIQFVSGRKSLNKLNQKFFQEIEDIMMII